MSISILASIIFLACNCGDDNHKKVSAQELSNNTSTIDISTIVEEVQVESPSSEEEQKSE
jgi:hypothetical protein